MRNNLIIVLGVDPKSVLCELFRIGQCLKGNKCKYSHDLNVERRAQKIDIYTDRRQEEQGGRTEKKAFTLWSLTYNQTQWKTGTMLN